MRVLPAGVETILGHPGRHASRVHVAATQAGTISESSIFAHTTANLAI